MNFITAQDIRFVLETILIIITTHAIVLIIFSFCASGDAFLALKNFYNITYHLGV